MRAILPGLAYQLGNLALSRLAPFQAGLAEARGNDFASVLAGTLVVVAVALAIVAWLGPERRARELTASE